MRALPKSCVALAAALVLAAAGCNDPANSSNAYVTPYAPNGVSATPGNGQVTISWSSVVGATSYNLYASTTAPVTPANGTQVTLASSPFVDTSVTNGTPSYYVVTAVNPAGESPASQQVSAIPAVNPAPASPLNVTATASFQQVTLAWSAVTGATSYNLYWSPTSGASTTGTLIPAVTSPYVHAPLTTATPYYYVVTAVNANGESTPSAQVSATPGQSPYIDALVLSTVDGLTPPFGFLEQVEVYTDDTFSTPISDATVTVNQTPLAYDASHEAYRGTVSIAAGATVDLEVTINSQPYSATGTQFTTANAPTLKSPASGATWSTAIDNSISWSNGAPPAGAITLVGVVNGQGQFGFPSGSYGGPEEVALRATSTTVPASSLSVGSYSVMVGIGTAGLSQAQAGTGIGILGATSDSGLWLGLIAPVVPITVGP